jgi:glycosyltransferase involved in cell wall biosynthesis
MMGNSTNSHRPDISMVGYFESPTGLPPMLHAAMSFADAGRSVTAICISNGSSLPLREVHCPGFETRRVLLRTRRFFHARFGLSPSNRLLALFQYVLTYGEFVVKAAITALGMKPVVYEAHDLPALLPTCIAGVLRRTPVVYHAHELYPEMHANFPFARFWRILERGLMPFCTLVVTPEENRSRIYRNELKARETLTVRNCPPYRKPVRSNKLQERLAGLGITPKTIVLYQGLFDPSRCIMELAEASRLFDEGVVLVLIGSGFKEWAQPQQIMERFERVVVLPRAPYEELWQYTASADIGVLFYRNDCRNNYYCAPNKLHEYMMMGLSVVTCNYPGMKQIVEGETLGLCVNPEQPEEIAAAVNRLAADSGLRERIGVNALRLSKEHYNWEKEFAALFNRYASFFGALPAAGSVPHVHTPGGVTRKNALARA